MIEIFSPNDYMMRHRQEGTGWLAQVRDKGDKAILSAVHQMLATRDVRNFAASILRNTRAKDAMIEARKTPVDISIEVALEELGTDIFTVNLLTEYMFSKDMPEIRDMKFNALRNQVNGWAKSNSEPPQWVTHRKQPKVKVDQMAHFPRVLMFARASDGAINERIGANELRFLVQNVAMGAGAPVKIPKCPKTPSGWDELGDHMRKARLIH